MNSKIQKFLGILFLILALFFIIAGMARTHKVYEDEQSVFYYKVAERRLVVDATFAGVIRRGTKLYTTYDRTAAIGKRPCPT
jgi:hypothetical protein